jgi:urease accessory protein UreF
LVIGLLTNLPASFSFSKTINHSSGSTIYQGLCSYHLSARQDVIKAQVRMVPLGQIKTTAMLEKSSPEEIEHQDSDGKFVPLVPWHGST